MKNKFLYLVGASVSTFAVAASITSVSMSQKNNFLSKNDSNSKDNTITINEDDLIKEYKNYLGFKNNSSISASDFVNKMNVNLSKLNNSDKQKITVSLWKAHTWNKNGIGGLSESFFDVLNKIEYSQNNGKEQIIFKINNLFPNGQNSINMESPGKPDFHEIETINNANLDVILQLSSSKICFIDNKIFDNVDDLYKSINNNDENFAFYFGLIKDSPTSNLIKLVLTTKFYDSKTNQYKNTNTSFYYKPSNKWNGFTYLNNTVYF